MDRNLIKNAIQKNKLKINNAQYPTYQQMAKNLGSDIAKNVKSVLSGNTLKADDVDVNRRQSICKQCQYFDASQERCTKCGCYMAVKSYLKASSCPIGKW